MIEASLSAYLTYMKSLGYTGLALAGNPFDKQDTQAPSAVVAARNTPVTNLTRGAEPAKPPPITQNLFSIMEMVNAVSPTEETQQRAKDIQGGTRVDVLRNLYSAFQDCQACALGTTRTKFVFGEGPPDASLMFVGEGPGEQEDLSGRPFVGKAGQLLDKIIQAMGFQRNQVFIANVVKCRPPGNRSPLPDEISTCSPILVRQIETLAPQIIVALGASSLRFFAGSTASITRMRGRFFEWRGFQIMPTFHPAYILRNPRAKREVWADMQQVMDQLKSN